MLWQTFWYIIWIRTPVINEDISDFLFFEIFCKNWGNFSAKMLTEKIGPRTEYHNITFLVAQCVGKMIQVSNLL